MLVLVVDDEPDLCALIADALSDEGHQVTCVKDGAAAMQAAATRRPSISVLADMRLPHVDGLTLFRRLRTQSPATDMILMTGDADVADAVAVLKEGAFDYLTKPVRLDELGLQLAAASRLTGPCTAMSPRRARSCAKATPCRDRLVGHSPGCWSSSSASDAIAHSDAAGAHHGRERHRQGAGGARAPRRGRAARQAVRGGQLRGISGHADRVASCSATNAARSPAPPSAATDVSRRRTAARCSWTKWPSCHRRRRPSCCACCRKGRSSRWAATSRSRSTCASSPRPTGTSRQRIAEGLFREDLYYRINTIDLDDPAAARPFRGPRDAGEALPEALLQAGRAAPASPGARWNVLSAYHVPGQRSRADAHHRTRDVAGAGRQDRSRASPRVGPRRPRRSAGARRRWRPLGAASQGSSSATTWSVSCRRARQAIRAAESLGISRKNLWEKIRLHAISDLDQDAPRPSRSGPPTPSKAVIRRVATWLHRKARKMWRRHRGSRLP